MAFTHAAGRHFDSCVSTSNATITVAHSLFTSFVTVFTMRWCTLKLFSRIDSTRVTTDTGSPNRIGA